MDWNIRAGDTDKTIYLRLRDSTTGLAKTGLVYNSAGAVASYTLPLAARAAITLATQTVTGAHSDGGFVEVDATNCKGLYRLDLPDAAIASGAFVIISIEFDGIIEESLMIPLANAEVDVVAISGDATAADNLEAACDGNTYNIGGGAVVAASVTGAVGSVTGNVGGVAGTITTLDALDTAQDTQHSTTQGKVDTAQADLDLLTGADGATLATTQGNYAPAKAGDAMALTSGERTTLAGVIWNSLTSGMSTAGSIGKKLADWTIHSAADVWSVATRVLTAATNITSTGGTTVPQTGDSYARLGAPAGASVSADVAAVKTDTGNLVTRITATLFSGITQLSHWLGAIAGKQAANATAQTEIRASGAGSGTFDPTTDSVEAIRDRGDAAWTTGGGGSGNYALVGAAGRDTSNNYRFQAWLLGPTGVITTGLSNATIVGVFGNNADTDLTAGGTSITIGTDGRIYGHFTLTTQPTDNIPLVIVVTVDYSAVTYRGHLPGTESV